ncbi:MULTISPECIES: kynureninase [Thalassospira]|uniref:kynureninase n=1 Tax=Thalassospira TaxID=168934 RepID=UPI0008DD8B34|nr:MULTISPECIES: kynureninase [Thalassospira]MAB34060.1 kynureninase [Thalassospira sp.]MDM7977689.1 kynureninase [Thalassospira xiamenensis]OHY98926.1 kynureninase [Thalassospira sp. MIT1004]HBS23126.1 kynureninase [Thalassospira sp.]
MIDFAATKALFHIPDGVIYLDGNSLGAMPKTAAARAKSMISDEWGEMLIRGWNDAGWMEQPKRVGDLVARLIGAAPGTVVMGDTLSIKVYQALASALEMNPDRKVVVSDNGNFPTDLYIADGLIKSLDKGHVLKTPNPEDVESLINEDLAVLMLTHVDYRTGRMYDMKRITKMAHDAGAIVIWDLAHSAGAVPVDLAGCEADFAVGCTYKYLNGGPGAPAFIYVRPDHAKTVRPALSGWLGHAAPFAFDLEYSPAPDVSRMRVGTPPVIQMTVLEEAMKAWDGVEMVDIRKRSIELCEQFIAGGEASCPMLELASPRDATLRGSQVSFRFENGYAVMQALIARGVIGDFRAPDIIRFGFTPLYIDNNDVDGAVKILAEIMETRAWDKPEFHKRNAVT